MNLVNLCAKIDVMCIAESYSMMACIEFYYAMKFWFTKETWFFLSQTVFSCLNVLFYLITYKW